MDIDPHTLQQILRRIEQQMRCPQCGNAVPMDFTSFRVLGEGSFLLQLKCEGCNAHMVLQASLQSVEKPTLTVSTDDECTNASSRLNVSEDDVQSLRSALQNMDGSFSSFFQKDASADAQS